MLARHITPPKTCSSDCYPLTCATRGETVTMTEIRAGERMRHRLQELGLNIGMRVRIVQGDASGTIILAVQNDGRLAIGRGMAQKIMVTHFEGNE